MRRILTALFLGLGLAQAAAAQDFTCSGRSLLEEFERERPDIWAGAVDEFEATPNSTGLFWRIEREGVAPSWLLGTMHVADPRITALREPVADALAEADMLVVEAVEVVDPELRFEVVARMQSIAMLPEGETFDEGFTEEQKQALGAMTAAVGVPYFAARRMKPWFISILLSLPPCAVVATLRGEPVLDEKLYIEATTAGLNVVGLESLDEQMEALASLEAAIDAEALLQFVELGPQVTEDWYATLIDLYLRETVSLLMPLLDRVPEFAAMAASMDEAEDALVVIRNHRMHERLLPLLDEGNVFVGVGALHLSGDIGLVELLRKSGYIVTRVP